MSTGTEAGVREIIANAKIVESDGSRAVAMLEVVLCLEDGSRVKAEDRRRLVVDMTGALSQRAAVSSSVRAFLREQYGESPDLSLRL